MKASLLDTKSISKRIVKKIKPLCDMFNANMLKLTMFISLLIELYCQILSEAV